MAVKARVWKTMVLTLGLYGGEIWGMSGKRTEPLEKINKQAIRVIAGFSTKSLASIHGLRHELDIPSVEAMAAARRSRRRRGHL